MNENKILGEVLWICGLSGAGKTTLAIEVVKRLRTQGKFVVMLDGDELRKVFGEGASTNKKSHGRDDRLSLAYKYAHLCRILAEQGLTVVIATISLFREIHSWNRKNLPNYFEVYLDVPIEELRRRDPKDIYKKFDSGIMKDVAGLDLIVEKPEAADWVEEFNQFRSASLVAEDLIIELGKKLSK